MRDLLVAVVSFILGRASITPESDEPYVRFIPGHGEDGCGCIEIGALEVYRDQEAHEIEALQRAYDAHTESVEEELERSRVTYLPPEPAFPDPCLSADEEEAHEIETFLKAAGIDFYADRQVTGHEVFFYIGPKYPADEPVEDTYLRPAHSHSHAKGYDDDLVRSAFSTDSAHRHGY